MQPKSSGPFLHRACAGSGCLMPESCSTLHERMHKVAAGRSYKQLSDLTGTHPETVRRYMQGQAPSTDFLSQLCIALELNADWLLLGRGPMLAPEAIDDDASHTEQLRSMHASISTLTQRVASLEDLVRSLNARLHGARALLLSGEWTGPAHDPGMIETKPAQHAAQHHNPTNTDQHHQELIQHDPE